MLASRAALASLNVTDREKAAPDLNDQVREVFPVQSDWAIQDIGLNFHKWFLSAQDTDMEVRMIRKAIAETGPDAKACEAELDRLVSAT